MLTIRETFDGYSHLKALDENIHVTEALDGKVIAFIAYAYTADSVIIYDYNDNGDVDLCDGLIRSVLLKACLRGIGTAEFKIIHEEKFSRLALLRFINDDSRLLYNINDFMSRCTTASHDDLY